MKILVVGSHLNYNLEYFVFNSLKDMGFDVEFFGYKKFFENKYFTSIRMLMTRSKNFRNFIASPLFLNKFNKEFLKLVFTDNWDLIISIKGEAISPKTLKTISAGTKLALWFPDDPRFFNGLVKYIAPHYDYVFTVSTEKSILSKYSLISKHVNSLPVGCYKKIHHSLENIEKKFDISFIGSYTPYRRRIIKKLRQEGFNVVVFGSLWRRLFGGCLVFDPVYGPYMVKIINQSKISLNIHAASDLGNKVNQRTFEVTGSGGILLSDHAFEIEKFFKLNKEIFVYENMDDLIKKIKMCLKMDLSQLNEIGKMAEKKAHQFNTYENRMKTLLQVIKNN